MVMEEQDKFTLHSGERQIGTRLQYIRPDHIARYQTVVDNLKLLYPETSGLRGVDAFCGNGYGSYLISTRLNCSMWGIDGSNEAIIQAHHHYSTSKTFYTAKYFPFDLPHNSFDFATSIESIEHVEDSTLLMYNLINSVKVGGYIFASVPNENYLPLSKNPNKFHFRHFRYKDFIKLARGQGDVFLKKVYAQNTYVMGNGKVMGYLPDKEMKMTVNSSRGQFFLFMFQKMS